MHYQLQSKNNVRIASIQEGATNAFYARLKVDFHDKSTTRLSATGLVYQAALLSGAGKLDREAFLDAVNRIGASISVSVEANTLDITLQARAEQAGKLLKLFTLMMSEPAFSAKEIVRIKKNVQNEIEDSKEDARGLAQLGLKNSLFGSEDRRYTAHPDKLKSIVPKITKQDLQQLHQLCLESSWVATAGTDSKAVAAFTNALKKLKKDRGLEVLTRTHKPQEVEQQVATENVPGKENIELSIGGPLPMTVHHPDYIPFVFGLSVLGKWGGFTGRLMSTVREKEGLTYGIYARPETITGTETGYWRIMTFFSPTDTKKGLDSTFREVKKIAKHGITEDEYIRFKTILSTQQTLLGDSYIRSVEDLHAYNSAGLTLQEMQQLKAKVTEVSRDEINAALKKYLTVSICVVSAAGPIKKVPFDLSTYRPGKKK